eukprot:c29644_g1_i1 orf=1-291(-)
MLSPPILCACNILNLHQSIHYINSMSLKTFYELTNWDPPIVQSFCHFSPTTYNLYSCPHKIFFSQLYNLISPQSNPNSIFNSLQLFESLSFLDHNCF